MIYPKHLLSVLLIKLLAVNSEVLRTQPRILQEATVSVPNTIPYGESIHVTFTNPRDRDPKKWDWIAIFVDSDAPLDEYDMETSESFWAYTNGSQDEDVSAPYPEEGVTTFGVKDPVQEDDQQWPIVPGEYRVCLAAYTDNYYDRDDDEHGESTHNMRSSNNSDDYEVIGLCQRFTIEFSDSQKELIENEAKIVPTKTVYKHHEAVIAHFKTPVDIHNSWVGIYHEEDRKPDADSISSELMWVYTGCDNVGGDQRESNDCARLRKEGVSWFDHSTTGRSDYSWPLPPGRYCMVLVYYNNYPIEVFKWSEAEDCFEVLEPGQELS